MFRHARVFILVWCGSFVAHGQQAKSTVVTVQSLIRSQQYDQALQITTAALGENPRDGRLWTLEGIAYSLKGADQDALQAFDKALTISPENMAALRGEVQIYYRSLDKRAIPLLERILSIDKKDETGEEMLAVLEQRQGDCTAAIDHFALSANALAKHPTSLESYGDCLVQAGQPEKAIPVFEQLVALLPQRNYPKYDLAVVLLQSKQNDAALKVLAPLVAANPADPEFLSLASDAYEAAGDTPKAVSLLRDAIVLDPVNAGYYAAFAALSLTHESYQVGIDMINAGLQRIPKEPSMYISRGLLYAQLAQYDEAETDFETAERLDAKQSVTSYALDLAELQKNNSDKALAQIRDQLKVHPESALLHYLLAKLLSGQGSGAGSEVSAEAIREALVAVKLKPDLIEARDLLASMYARSDHYDLAIEQCHIALQYNPSDEPAIYHLIVALRHSGQGEERNEIKTLVKRLSELQTTSRQKETDRKRFRLVEGQAPAQP